MTMQHFFGDDSAPQPRPAPDTASPIEEIITALRVVARLAGALPSGAGTARLTVAIEAVQAAAAAHGGAR